MKSRLLSPLLMLVALFSVNVHADSTDTAPPEVDRSGLSAFLTGGGGGSSEPLQFRIIGGPAVFYDEGEAGDYRVEFPRIIDTATSTDMCSVDPLTASCITYTGTCSARAPAFWYTFNLEPDRIRRNTVTNVFNASTGRSCNVDKSKEIVLWWTK